MIFPCVFFFIIKAIFIELGPVSFKVDRMSNTCHASKIKVHMSIINFCHHGFVVFFRLVTPTLDIEMKGKNSC